MAPSPATSALLLALNLYTAYAQNDTCDPDPCVSYGVDFQGGGSYFQNISSSDPFTFVSLYEGCQADTVDNILVDPSGDEYQCSDTSLTPDDTNQLSTCPLMKDQLVSGDWSLLLISNNGEGCPIAYERDFYLTVDTPSTYYYTPTVTLSATSTPIQNITATQTSTSTITSTIVVTSPQRTIKPTTTLTPRRVTTTTTITLGTISKTKYTAVPTLVTKTQIQTCSVPPRQPWADPTCSITPTLVSAAALSTDSASATSAQARRRDNARRLVSDREVRVAERKARLAGGRKDKRGLDVAITTVTDLNTSDYPTITLTSTAPTLTMSITTILTLSTTSTTMSTTLSGTTTLTQVTITAPTPTKTQTSYTVLTTTVATVTKHPVITVTVHTAPAQSTAVCQAKGGKMVG